MAYRPAPGPLVSEGVTEKIDDHTYVIPDANVSLVANVGMEDDLDREDDLSDLERQPDDYYEDEELFLQEPTDADLDQRDWDYEPSPEERWQAYLNWENESERLQQLVDALVAVRCNRGELLQALIRVKTADVYRSAPRRRLLKFVEAIHQAREYEPLSIGDRFSNDDWAKLQDLLDRYEEHLRAEAERAKRNPDRARTSALVDLMNLVHKWTCDFQYQLLSELLCLFVDDKLTYDNLRQYASRTDLTTKMAARPKVPHRKTNTEVGEVGRSQNASKRWGQSATDYKMVERNDARWGNGVSDCWMRQRVGFRLVAFSSI